MTDVQYWDVGKENGCSVGGNSWSGWAAVAAVPDPLHFTG